MSLRAVPIHAKDFPAVSHLQDTLDEVGLELDDSYQGSSDDPFLAEAFRHALRTGKTSVLETFATSSSKDKMTPLQWTAERFGVQEKVLAEFELRSKIFTKIYSGGSLYHSVMATMSIQPEGKLPALLRPVPFSHLMTSKLRITGNPFMSSNQIISLLSVCRYLDMLGSPSTVANMDIAAKLCFTFTNSEVDILLSSDLPLHRLSMAMSFRKELGVADVSEILETLTSLPEEWLNRMFTDSKVSC